MLIVGCGCRGRALARALAEDGHAVRGTTRDPGRLREIEQAGAEGVVADPDRLATVTTHLAGVAVLAWLMGTASGSPDAVAALHGPRLASMAQALVDTHVRGLVYEAAGTAGSDLFGQGAAAVASAGETHRMPVEVVTADPGRVDGWVAEMRAAVGRVLAA